MILRLQWSTRDLKLSKVQGLVVVPTREPVEVRKVLLALHWSGKLFITALHQAPKDLTQETQSH